MNNNNFPELKLNPANVKGKDLLTALLVQSINLLAWSDQSECQIYENTFQTAIQKQLRGLIQTTNNSVNSSHQYNLSLTIQCKHIFDVPVCKATYKYLSPNPGMLREKIKG